jgi:hypothetical protein
MNCNCLTKGEVFQKEWGAMAFDDTAPALDDLLLDEATSRLAIASIRLPQV